MAANFVNIDQMNALKAEVSSLRDTIGTDMQKSNEALTDIASVLGGSTSVSKSIERFQNASTEEQNKIIAELRKMDEFLDGKIKSYQAIYSDASQSIKSSSAEGSVM